jgi:hypothetical protein
MIRFSDGGAVEGEVGDHKVSSDGCGNLNRIVVPCGSL